MPKLIIVANIHATADKIDLLEAELTKLVGPTRAEAGCIQYDLHRDNTDPAHFMFYEIWESRTLWQAHMGAPHIAAYGAATEGAVDAVTLAEMPIVA